MREALGLSGLEEPVQQRVAALLGAVRAVSRPAEQVNDELPQPGREERREHAPPGGRRGGRQRQVPGEVLHHLEQGTEQARDARQHPRGGAENRGGLQAVRLDERRPGDDGQRELDHATEQVGRHGVELHHVLRERDATQVRGAVGDDGDEQNGERERDEQAVDERRLGQVCRSGGCGGVVVVHGIPLCAGGRDSFPDLSAERTTCMWGCTGWCADRVTAAGP